MSSQRKFTFAISSTDEFLVEYSIIVNWWWWTDDDGDDDDDDDDDGCSTYVDPSGLSITFLVISFLKQVNNRLSTSTRKAFREHHHCRDWRRTRTDC